MAHILKRDPAWGYKSLHRHVWCWSIDLEVGMGVIGTEKKNGATVRRRSTMKKANAAWVDVSNANYERLLWRHAAADSPWIVGHQSHWAGTCSHTAAAQHAPATLPQAGPGLYHRPHLLREGSASAGRSRSVGSSGTQRTTHGIATSSLANRSRAECSSTRQGRGETGSRPGVRGSQSKDGARQIRRKEE